MKYALVLLALFPILSPYASAECSNGAATALADAARAMNRVNLADAESLLRKVNADPASCPGILLMRARIAAAKDQTQEATDLFRSYLALEPRDGEGYAYFARYLNEAGDYDHADQASAEAFELAPGDPVALSVRGQLVAMKGDRQGGIDLLTRASALDPTDEETQFQLGAIYDRAKLPGDAVKHFQKATELDSNDARAWDFLALQLEPLGQVSEADKAYQAALKVNQEGPHYDAFLDYNYGRFLMKKGDLAGSKMHLDKAIQLVPDMRAVWYERARLSYLLRSYDAARKEAEKAVSIADPDGLVIDLQLYSLLAQIYRRSGETELANKFAELARTTPPPVRREHH